MELFIDIICWLIALDFFLVLLAAAIIILAVSIRLTIYIFKNK